MTHSTATGRALAEARHRHQYEHPVVSEDGRWIAARVGTIIVIYHGKGHIGAVADRRLVPDVLRFLDGHPG